MRLAFLLLMLLVPQLALAKNTIAVHYFNDAGLDEQMASVKVGLTQMILNDLVGSEAFDVVERQQLQKVLDELDLGHSGMVQGDSAAKIGKLLGVRYFVFGDIAYLGFLDSFVLNARLVDVETGVVMKSHKVEGKKLEFMELQRQLSEFVRTAAAALPDRGGSGASTVPTSTAPAAAPSRTDPKAVPPAPSPSGTAQSEAAANRGQGTTQRVAGTPEMHAPDPKAVEAALAYSEGLLFMDAGDEPKARERFQAALTSKPNLAHAKAALDSMEI